MKYMKRVVLVLACALLLWTFVGVEAVDNEHSTAYTFFMKQHPSLTFVYRNPVTCGPCDLRRVQNIGPEANKRFEAFCRVRFDLDPGLCYAIYATEERRIDERYGRRSMRERFEGFPEVRKWAPGFPPGAPDDVLDFARARNLCDYFRQEAPEPEQRTRAIEVKAGIALYCPGTDQELARLRAKYQHNEEVARRLAEYDPVVEQGGKP
jgi:hypothetical protein